MSLEFKDCHSPEYWAAYTVYYFEKPHLHRAGLEVLKLASRIIFFAAAMINLSGM